MKEAYEDLDVDELVELLREARAKLRYLAAKFGGIESDYMLLVNRLIKNIDNALPKIYVVTETVTTKYETEIEASSESDARYKYENGANDDREEVDVDSNIEIEVV